jgi:hypothetical protein
MSGKAYDLGPVSVPVLWPGWGAVVFDGELAKGDEVLLIPCAPIILSWLLQGGVIDPEGPGRSVGNAFALPMRASAGRRPQSTADARLGRDDGTATILITVTGAGEVKIQAPSVVLGSAASPKLALARDTDPVQIGPAQLTWLNSVGTATMVGAFPASTIGTVDATSAEAVSG